MKLSFIIPTYNSGNTIIEAINSILSEHAPDIEIIVVNDASVDDTTSRLENIPLTLTTLPTRQGPAHARNYGAQFASGEVICFIDADVVLLPGWYTVLSNVFSSLEVDAVQGIYSLSQKTDNLITRFQNDYYHYSFITIPYKSVGISASYCFAIRKDVFSKTGGFDERVAEPTIEDEEFGYKLIAMGFNIHLEKQLVVKHLACYSLKSFTHRKLRMARSQIKAVFRRRSEAVLQQMVSKRENKTHHPVSTLLSIPIALGVIFSGLITLFDEPFGLLLSMLLLVSFCLLNWRFWRFCLSHYDISTMLGVVLFTFLDRVLLGIGILQGIWQYLRGARY